MFFYRAILFAAAALLLGGLPARSQTTTKPAPPPAPAPPPQKVLNVQVTLPTLVGRLGEMTGILVARDKKKPGRNATGNPVLYLAIPLPRIFGSDEPKYSEK